MTLRVHVLETFFKFSLLFLSFLSTTSFRDQSEPCTLSLKPFHDILLASLITEPFHKIFSAPLTTVRTNPSLLGAAIGKHHSDSGA